MGRNSPIILFSTLSRVVHLFGSTKGIFPPCPPAPHHSQIDVPVRHFPRPGQSGPCCTSRSLEALVLALLWLPASLLRASSFSGTSIPTVHSSEGRVDRNMHPRPEGWSRGCCWGNKELGYTGQCVLNAPRGTGRSLGLEEMWNEGSPLVLLTRGCKW